MQKIINYRGVRLNQRTIDMIEAAEKILGFKLRLTQGSYNAGGVAGSAGTHDGGGAVDIALKDAVTGALFPEVRRERIRAATRQVGFASWIRDPSQSNWPWHTHAIAVGDPDLSADARAQVTAYKNNRNGLASGGRDDGPRTWVGTTWEQYHAAHPDPTTPKELFTVGQFEELMQEQKRQGDSTRQEVRRQAIWGQRYAAQTEDERARADQAFDTAYGEAKAAGKSEAEALDAGQLASVRVMQSIADALKAMAAKNG